MTSKDTQASGQFSIAVDGVKVASFSELQGISTTVGPTSAPPRRLLGHELTHTIQQGARSGALKLSVKASHIGSLPAQRLRMAVGRKMTLQVADDNGRPVARYQGTLKAADPSKTADSVTIVCEHLQRVGV